MEQLLKFTSSLSGRIDLPTSKSISNRVLILRHLSGDATALHALSNADDTRVMRAALQQTQVEAGHALSPIDIHGAGTAMRFLTAAFATEGTHLITGSERMQQRPIGLLVDALRTLGADIDYVKNEGYPPLLIKGRPLQGGVLSIAANVSSQYISALLMIGPVLKEGLTLTLTGQMVSRPYVDMTLSLMRLFGAKVEQPQENVLRILPGGYQAPSAFTVEADWSAASYWYEMMALTPDAHARLVLSGLQKNSWQGDARVADYFVPLGVQTAFTSDGVILTKGERTTTIYDVDLTHEPDLAQTLAVTCAVLGQPFCLRGLNSLRIKETDRIAALLCELQKLGCTVHSQLLPTAAGDMAEALCGDGHLLPIDKDNAPLIHTYVDHRMAMSFAPAAYLHPGLRIADAEVVDKSYPHFWQELQKFVIHSA